MASVIGVRFRNAGKLYYFDPGPLWPTAGDAVIVETVRGMEYGEVVTGVREVSDELITPPLKKVIRIATGEDAQHQRENEAKEKDALALCQKKINEHRLQMKLVSCEYTFDNSKILFYFTADKRVDFRVLVKDLASVFRTRIELRQIGVRDEAKMMGGLGICGRPVCCAAFLGDFQPVSIKMAKEQNLSLNPTKISGVCGRLMCCLKYEEDHYEATRKRMPKVGKEVITPDGNGVVVDLNILKETVRVRIPKGDGTEQKDYALADVQRVTPPQRAPKAEPEKAPKAPKTETPDAPEAAQEVQEAIVPSPEEVTEFALDEGLTPEEALAEIEEMEADGAEEEAEGMPVQALEEKASEEAPETEETEAEEPAPVDAQSAEEENTPAEPEAQEQAASTAEENQPPCEG